MFRRSRIVVFGLGKVYRTWLFYNEWVEVFKISFGILIRGSRGIKGLEIGKEDA